MKKLKVYLETTIFNFFYADDAPDKRDDTIKLFKEIAERKNEAYTSYAVVNEINKASDETKQKLFRLFNEYPVAVLDEGEEVDKLADIYIAEGIIPLKYRDDAVHIAMATITGMDIILSWNFKHIVKRKTVIMVNLINTREGYKNIDIYSPSEVIENEDE
ncbi:MAG: type II toxin-antitoxin system VapC family toxin [Peptococcaceae bacterium]|nr:type II toxin-antitoxin system VapC family toxin [Peptococcaceae bacterium]